MDQPEKLRIAIIGGGIVGLCLATGLLKHEHLDVTIYEASSCFSEIGAGLTIAPNAKMALSMLSPELMSIHEKTRTPNLSPGRENAYMIFVKGTGEGAGELITAPESPGGHQSVHRALFLEEIAKLIPAERSRFNKRLIKIEEPDDDEEPIRLHFDDGTSELTDAVLGADGIHSFVREYLLGVGHPAARPVFTGNVAYRQIVPMDAAIEKLGAEHAKNATYLLGSGKGMFSYPLDEGQAVNLISIDYTQSQWTHQEWKVPSSKEELRSTFEGWGPQSTAMIDLLTTKPLMKWGLHDHLPAAFYNKGRIVMLGDAAHASLPYQGQGAAQGIEDAETLDALLEKTKTVQQLRYAFSAYDQIRRPRSQRMVQTTRETGLLISLQLAGVESDFVKVKNSLDSRFHWLWNRDIAAQNRAAVEIFEESLPREYFN